MTDCCLSNLEYQLCLLSFDSPEEGIMEVLGYLYPELMPRNPLKKYSMVSLCCNNVLSGWA